MKAFCRYCAGETVAMLYNNGLQSYMDCTICRSAMIVFIPDTVEPTTEDVNAYENSLRHKLIKKVGV